VLLSVLVVEMFSGDRKGVDVDKTVVVLLVTGSVLFFISGFLTFSQSSKLGQQIAVRSAGVGVLLGIVCAIAAMLKQQCYLQKLLAMARGRTQRGVPQGGNLWPTFYFIILLGVVAGATGVAWLRPDQRALAGSSLATAVPSEAKTASGLDSEGEDRAPALALNKETKVAKPIPTRKVEDPQADPMDGMGDVAMVEAGPDPVSELELEIEAESVEPAPVEEEAMQVMAQNIDPVALRTFKGSIVPMLKDRCVSCHGEDKQKGGLRLDSPSWIREGGNSGPVVIAFQPEKSYLYTSTILPADDPDIMPAKGKPLTSAQTSAIRRWIKGGAPMGDGKDEAAATVVAGNGNDSGGGGGELSGSVAETLKAAHIQFKPVADGLFEIDCSLTRNYPETKLNLAILGPIASTVHTLDLSKTKVSDADLALLAKMLNLTRLLLSRTTVGDEAMTYVSGLAKLEVLNLYGTNVTDEGLEQLRGLSQLKKLYLWNSKATAKGGNTLKRKIPDLEVNVGQ
jgi:hypothetical protein